MNLTPAEYVTRVFGGIHNTAKALDRSAQSVSKWNQPRKKGGCGGRIPGTLHKPILNRADVFQLDITHRDLIEGREISEKKIPGKNSSIAMANNAPTKITKEVNMAERNEGESKVNVEGDQDYEWFNYRIQSRHESQRKFAPKVIGENGNPLDVSAINLTIHGKRQMTLDEVCQFARLLNEDVMEVFERACRLRAQFLQKRLTF